MNTASKKWQVIIDVDRIVRRGFYIREGILTTVIPLSW